MVKIILTNNSLIIGKRISFFDGLNCLYPLSCLRITGCCLRSKLKPKSTHQLTILDISALIAPSGRKVYSKE